MISNLSAIQHKIYSEQELLINCDAWTATDKKIVFTNGVFDILHRGHIEYLAKAADFGDVFIVAINSDASVKRLGKGDSRPLQDENSRALIIAALSFVDAVIVFNDDTPFNIITAIKPNVLVKGGDYDASISDISHKKYIVGSDVVKNNGGKTEVISFVKGYSTSKIEEKILKEK